MTDNLNPIDVHVGKRMREVRIAARLNERELAEELSVTTEQLQRYESGVDRIGAAHLFRAAKMLDVPVGYFYVGLSEPPGNSRDTEVDPGNGTRGLIGKSAVPLLNGADHDEEDETED